MVNEEPIRFPNWESELLRGVESKDRDVYFDVIDRFLLVCSLGPVPVTVSVIESYLEELEAEDSSSKARLALRWFYRAAKKSSVKERTPKGLSPKAGIGNKSSAAEGSLQSANRSVSSPAVPHDLGQSDWERDLIKAIRVSGLSWRTEETYRGWAVRWARFITPQSPYTATAKEVTDFLDQLAVKDRVSFATQKQALNALVFFLKKGLGLQLQEIPFRRARASRRVPTVLSREECSRVFNKLEGTTRLMAELMYGSGLRLMELLRLRVHHLDLARGTLQVRAGKGDKDRVTVLPTSLVARLETQLERLRSLLPPIVQRGFLACGFPKGYRKNTAEQGSVGSGSGSFLLEKPV